MRTGTFAIAVAACLVVGCDQSQSSPTTTIGVLAPPTTNSAAPPVTWAPMGRAVQAGDATVTIASAKIAHPRARNVLGAGDSLVGRKMLILEIQIANSGSNRKIDFYSWTTKDAYLFQRKSAATVTDDLNNSYKIHRVERLIGGTDAESIYPGKSATDLLLVEPPIEASQTIRVELPGENFGVDGRLCFEVPRSAIQVELPSAN